MRGTFLQTNTLFLTASRLGLRASLWNTRLSLKSRAQLAHYAWRSSEVVFPNKYQVLLDWMGEELAASAKRERHEQASDDDQAAVWKLYENALSSIVMNEKQSKYSVKQKTIHVTACICKLINRFID